MAKSTEATETRTDTGKQVQSAEFTEAPVGAGVGPGGSIDILLDMDVPVTVGIGRAEITVRKLLALGVGSVVKLDKGVNEPADLYLKGSRFATGEVVVVDGRFGVRITHILAPGNAAEPAQP